MTLRPRIHTLVTGLALAGLSASVVTPAAGAEPQPRPAQSQPAAPVLADVPPGNAMPVPAPHQVSFGNDWHACRDGCARQHKGTDVFATEGTPIVAVESGIVAAVDNVDDGNGGLSVWLRGDSGVAYYYAHNSANYVAVGQRVGRGQMLGRVGHTGNARTTPPHVHFQVNRCGALDSAEPCTENPYDHLSRWAPGEIGGGADALGLYRRSQATAELRVEGGSALPAFVYGQAPEESAQVVAGDWNGDGRDTVGLYRRTDATFALRDDAGGVLAPLTLGTPGDPGAVPVAGDWNGDGRDTVGLYRVADGTFVLLDDTGAAMATLAFGPPGATDAVPVVGDWDGDGRDAVGVYRTADATFRLRDEIGAELPPVAFGTVGAAELPVTGDWDGDGRDALGVYQRSTSTFVLGGADPLDPATGARTFVTGDQPATDLVPLVGDWNGLDVVTLDDLRAIFGPLGDPATEATIAGQLPVLNEALLRAGAVTPARKAAFLATLRHESALRADAVEATNPSPYRGRGFIQLTGVFNYRSAGEDLGVDLVAAPDLAAQPATSALLAAWYWTVARDINYAADRLDMAAVNIAIGFRPTVREDMERCADFVRALKWFSGGLLPEGVNCERSADSRLVALATVPGPRPPRSAAPGTRLPTTTTAPRAVPLPALGTEPAPPPLDPGPLVPPTPGVPPTTPTTPTTRPPTTPTTPGGPPSTDDPTPPDTTPTTPPPPDTTTTTVPDTTTTTNDIPPGWTDPGGGGINP